MPAAPTPASVDEYIARFPPEVAEILERIRRLAADVVPGSGETISYQMPTVTIDGDALLYYAGWAKHIGIYPIPRFDGPLEAEVAPYRAAKDSLRLPLNRPMPYDLIERVLTAMAERHD